jgi:hypothetical protein
VVSIGVVESRWHRRRGIHRNTSVRPLFEYLCKIERDGAQVYEYTMADDEKTLELQLTGLSRNGTIRAICVAMHGKKEGLQPYYEDKLVINESLKSMLIEATKDRRSKIGLYLEACEFGNQEVAACLLNEVTMLDWVAGFSKSADFMYSTIICLLFFTEWLDVSGRQRIKSVAGRLADKAPGLCEKTGFSIFVRKAGGGVQDLLGSQGDAARP